MSKDKQKGHKILNAYCATSCATTFPLLLTQQNKQRTKDFTKKKNIRNKGGNGP